MGSEDLFGPFTRDNAYRHSPTIGMADDVVKYERKYSAVLFRGAAPSRLGSSASRFPPFLGAHFGRPSFPSFQPTLATERNSGRVFPLVRIDRLPFAYGLPYNLGRQLIWIPGTVA